MEKSSFCSNLRQQSMNNSSRNTRQGHEFKVRSSSSWDFGNEYSSSSSSCWGEADLMGAGFSWPPRSYICSFCKREFRSAQALGGHMNVHRRDRARLRQSPTTSPNRGHFSLLNLNLDPNPSFNSNPISSPTSPPPFPSLLTKFPQFTPKLPPLGPLPDEITVDLIKPKAAKVLFGVQKFHLSVNEKRCEDFKRSESVRLDLEIGLISQSEEELDLELRLGYT